MRESGAKRPIVILGAGGHGRVVLELCRLAGHPVAGFLDRTRDAAPVRDCPVLGDDDLLNDRSFVERHDFAVGVGAPDAHRRLTRLIGERGGRLPVLRHPAAFVSPSAALGPGTAVMAGAVVGVDTRVGRGCVVNTGAVIDHDGVLDEGVHVGPGAALAGGVRCGAGAVVGTGAVILPGLRIGAGATVGAGAVVVADVADGATVVGPKARPIA